MERCFEVIPKDTDPETVTAALMAQKVLDSLDQNVIYEICVDAFKLALRDSGRVIPLRTAVVHHAEALMRERQEHVFKS